VNHSGSANGVLVAEDAFFVDGKIEENDEGESIKDGEETKETEWEHVFRRVFG